jgi:hypothetical protein
MWFVQRQERRDRKADLAIHLAASRGDPKEVRKHLAKDDDR